MTTLLVFVLLASPIAIENARVEVGDGTVLDKATVVIDDGRIQSVGGGMIPAGATRIDAAGKVLAPGFIETYTQLGLAEVMLEDETRDDQLEDSGYIVPGFRAADGFFDASPRFAITREEGVLSIVTSPTGGVVAGSAAWVDLAPGARPDASKPVAMFGDVGKQSGLAGARGGVWLLLRQLAEDTRFYQKNQAAFDRGDARELIVSPLHLRAFLPVLEGTLPFVVRASRASDIRAALAYAKEHGVRLIIVGGTEAWRVADELAAAKVPVILTRPSAQQAFAYDALLARDDSATLLQQAGVPLVISSADGDQNARRLRQEAGVAVAYGLPHAAAIRAITGRPAEVFGRGDVGMVAKGKRANLVLWSGDVLELSSIAERVFIDGKELPLDNRQRKLVDRYLPR